MLIKTKTQKNNARKPVYSIAWRGNGNFLFSEKLKEWVNPAYMPEKEIKKLGDLCNQQEIGKDIRKAFNTWSKLSDDFILIERQRAPEKWLKESKKLGNKGTWWISTYTRKDE